MRLGFALVAALLSVGRIAHGQVPQNPPDTTSYEGLVKAAQDAVDRGEFAPTADQRAALYKSAEQYARRAVSANPNDADGHFELAVAIGRNALTMGARDRVKYAAEVRDQALNALKLNPNHAGAEHVLGVWNAEVMRLSGFTRLVAKKLMGGQVFDEASWENAQKHLERAVSLEPNRITHRLDLAAVYVDRDQKDKAIEQYEWIGRAPSVDFNDGHYKEEASRRLKDLR
jgi:tetratricopeptide (TPR) repeat protein